MGVLTSPGQTHCADCAPATVVSVYFQVWRRYPSPHSHVWGMVQCSLRCSCSSSFNRQGQPQSPSFDMWPRQSATFQQATLHHCTLPLLASLATLGLQHKNGSDSRYQLVDMQHCNKISAKSRSSQEILFQIQLPSGQELYHMIQQLTHRFKK